MESHQDGYRPREQPPEFLPLAGHNRLRAHGRSQQQFQLAAAPRLHKKPARRPTEQAPLHKCKGLVNRLNRNRSHDHPPGNQRSSENRNHPTKHPRPYSRLDPALPPHKPPHRIRLIHQAAADVISLPKKPHRPALRIRLTRHPPCFRVSNLPGNQREPAPFLRIRRRKTIRHPNPIPHRPPQPEPGRHQQQTRNQKHRRQRHPEPP